MNVRGDVGSDDRGGIANGALLVAIGVVLVAVGAYMLANAGAVTGEAVPVEARIVESGVIEDGGAYRPVVVYRYEFGDRTYESDRIFPGGERGYRVDRARRLADRYPEGTTVTAYVDADRPRMAHLVRGDASPLYHLFVGAGAVVTLLGVGHLLDRLFGFRGSGTV